jgi:hypothetical protein
LPTEVAKEDGAVRSVRSMGFVLRLELVAKEKRRKKG